MSPCHPRRTISSPQQSPHTSLSLCFGPNWVVNPSTVQTSPFMAVQAQYPSNAFSPDSNKRPRHNVLKQMDVLQQRAYQMESLLGAYTNQGQRISNPVLISGQQMFNSGTVFSSDHQSDLTTNASGSRRKRNRDQDINQYRFMSQAVQYPNPAMFPATTSTAMQLPQEPSRLLEPLGASTSGRPSATIPAASQLVSPLTQHLPSLLHQESIEIDALILHQSERFRCGLEEASKRHCQALLLTLEQHALTRLREKEAELENARRRNAELEEKLKQVTAESKVWLDAAARGEAIVSGLRASLEQALLHSAAQAQEGYGDSEEAQSGCFGGEVKAERPMEEDMRSCRRECRACRERAACVLLLPCRHLCLCKDCEAKLDKCPICHSMKNTSLQVFMSGN